jgi:hypothetical protein
MTENRQTDLFLDILEKNIGIILKISRAYTNSVHDKEDLINDITLELWKSFERFKGDSKISTWIYRVAINTSMNFSRSLFLPVFIITYIWDIKYFTLIRGIDFTMPVLSIKKVIAELEMYKIKTTKIRYLLMPLAMAGFLLMIIQRLTSADFQFIINRTIFFINVFYLNIQFMNFSTKILLR